MRNIGNAFTKMGQYQDAVTSFDSIMESCPDLQSGFNLVVCHYALGNTDHMKRSFTRLISVPMPGADEEAELDEREAGDDELGKTLRRQRKEAHRLVSTAARLISPVLERDAVTGFNTVIEMLRTAGLADLASEMEISKAIYFLKIRAVDKAKEALLAFERKEESVSDSAVRSRAATNLCFLHFLEGDLKNADKYGTIAIKADRYNARALVNKGNCEFVKGTEATDKNKVEDARECFTRARELYMEAIGVEADCTEGIYNLGLVKRAVGLHRESLQAFEKLYSILPQSAEVIYQIASLHESLEKPREATRWFKLLISRVPSDAGVLQRYGSLLSKDDDEQQAYHFLYESYRYYPVDMDVISWLGAYFVKSEMYEKAIGFFERAAQIQPKEVKWRLMVASCHRRIGAFPKALRIYEGIDAEHPDNVECLKYLVRICSDLGMSAKVDEYQARLAKAERKEKMSQLHVAREQEPQMAKPSVGGGGNMGGGGMLDASAAVAAAAGDSHQPTKTFKKQVAQDDEWGDDGDVADLLPE